MARPQDRQRRPRVRLRPPKVERSRRLAMERLEDVVLLSYTVTNANDSGAGSLPFEIDAANTAGVAATIDFNIPGSGPITIAVGSTSGVQLPTIQVPLTIDGWSEGVFQGAANLDARPWIDIDGTALAGGANGLDLANAPGSTLQGLSMTNFHFNPTTLDGGNGIIVEGPSSGVTIQGDNIGVGADGTTPGGNDVTGIALFSTDAAVGGTTAAAADVISGNGNGPQGYGAGVFVASTPFFGPTATGNIIEGDKIGTDVTGAVAIANNYGVVLAGGVATTVGGTTSAAADVISGNSNAGVYLTSNGFGIVPSEPTSGNVVAGDLIGTDPTGTSALGNGLDGVLIDGGATGNTVGDGNQIAGNGQNGVEINGASTSGNLVAGNLIGTDVTGTTALPNTLDGVLVADGETGNTVGGTTAAAANIIAASALEGVRIADAGTTGNVVEGNFIGTNAAGATNLGNLGDGVAVVNLASNNTVGGNAPGAGNTIADNGGNGVTIGASPTDAVHGDSVLGNDIVSNAKIGIDLADDGVTLNDSAGHAGPNLFQDFPVLSRVDSGTATGTFFQGSVSGPANSTLRVEFFLNSAADPSGFGQGQTYLGYVDVATDASGVGTFDYHVATALPVGQFVSATATDASGNTSEFAGDVQVTPAPAPSYSLTFGGFLYNRTTKQFVQAVTLKNTGVDPILGPISLVLDNLTGGVTLVNATGTTTTGSPYIDLNLGAGDELLPNQSVSLLLDFGDPTRTEIRYNSRLILGPGPR